jgi:hypothetical protein
MKKNELYVSKLITEMPMLEMNHNARLVLYTVLKKIWLNFRNRYDYRSKEILTKKDYEIAQKPVVLKLPDLRYLFSYNASYKEIKEHIKKVPLVAEFQTYYDSFGVKKDYLIDTTIALFTKIQFDDRKKEVTFTPNEHLINYIEALKTFARIDIEEMKKLKGNYQIRGYELICQNSYVDKKNNKQISDEARKIKVSDFRRYFEIPDTYNTGNIDMRVLRPLQKAINSHTKYNIVAIKKYKLDSQDKKRVCHYRIDVEYKESYLNELQEKSNQSTEITETEIENQDTTKEFFNKVWGLYPLKKRKADVKTNDMLNLQELGYDVVKACIDRYIDYLSEKEKEGFNQEIQSGYTFFTKGYVDYLDENYTHYEAKSKNIDQNKPIQADNYEQRKYDDEFFDNLYDNLKYKKKDNSE